jgi:hypothetical protein
MDMPAISGASASSVAVDVIVEADEEEMPLVEAAESSPPMTAVTTTMTTPLQETLYLALQEDLHRKKYTDVTVAYFNQLTETGEVISQCHRLALAAKSRVLHRVLRGLDHEEDVRIIVVGDDPAEGHELVRTIYDPEQSNRNIPLWNEDNIGDWEDEWCTFCKRGADYEFNVQPVKYDKDEEVGDDDFIDDDNHEDLEGFFEEEYSESEMDDEKPIKKAKLKAKKKKKLNKYSSDFDDTVGGKRMKVDEPGMLKYAQKHGLDEEKVQELVNSRSKLIEYRDRGLTSSVWSKFNLLFCEGERIPYVCCMDCRLVRRFLPSKGPSLLSKHVRLCTNKEGVVVGVKERGAKEPDPNRPLSTKYLQQLLGVSSEKVSTCSPEMDQMSISLMENWDAIKFGESLVPYVFCKRCGKVLTWNKMKVGNLKRHTCKESHLIGPEAGQEASVISKEDLAQCINEKSGGYTTKPLKLSKHSVISFIFFQI